jgi:peptidoglycan/LPS O-acetylase OafA/YrhL
VQGYSPSTLLTGIGPAWSLAVELVFYVTLPALAAGAVVLAVRTPWGRRRPWLAALVPSGLLLLLGEVGHLLAQALPATQAGAWAGSWHAVVSRSFLAQCSLFAAGMAFAVAHVQIREGRMPLPRSWRAVATVTTLLVGATASVAHYRGVVEPHYVGLALSLACTTLIGLVVLTDGRRSVLTAVLSSRPLQWSGLVSYGVFLWNEPVVWLLRGVGATAGGFGGFALTLTMTAVVTVLLATASWFWVEKPALSFKRHARGIQTTGGLGTSVVAPVAP